MNAMEILRFAAGALRANRIRAGLSALGLAVGIAAVVLLTSIGEGVHQFVIAQFTQFGTNLIGISPGKVKTAGASIGAFATVRPLTIEDAQAIHRLPHIKVADPIIQGNAEIGALGRRRRVTVYGVGSEFPQALRMDVAVGQFLPKDDPHSARPFAVLGARVKREIFASHNPLGERLEISGTRYTIIGVMASKGQIFGIDLDDTVYVPVASAMELFNREGLMEIHVTYDPAVPVESIERSISALLMARHGRDDFTLTSQKESLQVLDSIMGVLTFAVAGLGSISVLVGAIGILTITVIGLRERRSEIGLLNALGATPGMITALFVSEAGVISLIGGTIGVIGGLGLAYLLGLTFTALPVAHSWFYLVLAVVISILVGIVSALLPARAAAKSDPVDALRTE